MPQAVDWFSCQTRNVFSLRTSWCLGFKNGQKSSLFFFSTYCPTSKIVKQFCPSSGHDFVPVFHHPCSMTTLAQNKPLHQARVSKSMKRSRLYQKPQVNLESLTSMIKKFLFALYKVIFISDLNSLSFVSIVLDCGGQKYSVNFWLEWLSQTVLTFSSSHIHTELHYTTVDHSDFAVQKHTKKNQVKCGILRYLQTRKYLPSVVHTFTQSCIIQLSITLILLFKNTQKKIK